VNERLFERLSTDPAWFAAHLGKVVGIVDGIVVSVGSVMDDVIKEMRAACPGRSRFVKTVEEQDEVFDIPSPCDIIES
jgi:chorismate synthase